jgi:hypothetical protein
LEFDELSIFKELGINFCRWAPRIGTSAILKTCGETAVANVSGIALNFWA